MRWHQGRADSSCDAKRNSNASWPKPAMKWLPMGKPDAPWINGIDMAGRPAMLTEEVKGQVCIMPRYQSKKVAARKVCRWPSLGGSKEPVGVSISMAARLECGKVSINAGGFPYPGLPEGGYKASGYGRDLGRDSVEQCLQTKTVLVRTS